jgi:hypothetical protein
VSDAGVKVPHLLAFIALCIVIGPAIGILGIFAQLWLATLFETSGPVLYAVPDFRFISSVLLVGYSIGAPVAFVAALIFAVAASRHGPHGLGTANLAALVAAILVTVALLIASEQGYYVPPWRLFRMMGGIAAMVVTSAVAMTACWLIARALGLFAIDHETAQQS